MLKANHTKWAEFIFDLYIFRLLKKNFLSIHLIGETPKFEYKYPIVLAPNHSTWWDGFFVYMLNKLYFQKKFHIMVLEEQLKKYKFFLKLGAYSIDQKNPKKIIESLNYTNDLLNNPDVMTTIFPQGELLPNFTRPLKFNKGIERVAKNHMDKLNIVPLAMKIHYLKEQRSQVFFKFGDTKIISNQENFNIESMSSETEILLDGIDNSIINNNFGETLLSGNVSVSHKSRSIFSKIMMRKNID